MQTFLLTALHNNFKWKKIWRNGHWKFKYFHPKYKWEMCQTEKLRVKNERLLCCNKGENIHTKIYQKRVNSYFSQKSKGMNTGAI